MPGWRDDKTTSSDRVDHAAPSYRQSVVAAKADAPDVRPGSPVFLRRGKGQRAILRFDYLLGLWLGCGPWRGTCLPKKCSV